MDTIKNLEKNSDIISKTFSGGSRIDGGKMGKTFFGTGTHVLYDKTFSGDLGLGEGERVKLFSAPECVFYMSRKKFLRSIFLLQGYRKTEPTIFEMATILKFF